MLQEVQLLRWLIKGNQLQTFPKIETEQDVNEIELDEIA
jgi:hypothetical protein